MAIPEIFPAWNAILTTLTSGPLAWRTPTELASLLAWDLEQMTDELASMDIAGWLDVWERPGDEEVAVTLSAWGADRLGVRLAESGGGLSLRWVEAGQPEPVHLRAKGVIASASLEELDLVFDALPAPGACLDDLDSEPVLSEENPNGPTFWPAPTQLLGERLTPWPGPGPVAERPGEVSKSCPVCQGRRLGPHQYCLRCDRWGLDHLLRPVPSRERPRAASHDRDDQAARKLRDRRKARRRLRLRDRFADPSQRQRRRRASAS